MVVKDLNNKKGKNLDLVTLEDRKHKVISVFQSLHTKFPAALS